jgi:hypothetical protein
MRAQHTPYRFVQAPGDPTRLAGSCSHLRSNSGAAENIQQVADHEQAQLTKEFSAGQAGSSTSGSELNHSRKTHYRPRAARKSLSGDCRKSRGQPSIAPHWQLESAVVYNCFPNRAQALVERRQTMNFQQRKFALPWPLTLRYEFHSEANSRHRLAARP